MNAVYVNGAAGTARRGGRRIMQKLSTTAQASAFPFDERHFLKYLIGKGYTDRDHSEPLIEKESPHHGSGLFAPTAISQGTVLGACVGTVHAPGSQPLLLELMAKTNDLHYSHSTRNISNPTVGHFTTADYAELQREYCDHDAIARNTNAYTLYICGTTSLGTMREMGAGEEVSRYYGLHFWLHNHLNQLLATGDSAVYNPSHPLVVTILSLKDTASIECFSKIRTHFGIWD
jgi:hypothetical protein